VRGRRPRDRAPAPENRPEASKRDERSANLIERERKVVGGEPPQRAHRRREEHRKGNEYQRRSVDRDEPKVQGGDPAGEETIGPEIGRAPRLNSSHVSISYAV